MKYSIGIDIGGTNTVFGLVSENGEIKTITKISTKGYNGFDDYLNEIADNVIKLCKEVSNTNAEIIGIGIGAPNGNYYKGVIDNAPNLEYKGVLQVKKRSKFWRIQNLSYLCTSKFNNLKFIRL